MLYHMMKSNQKWLKKIKISAEEIQERISFILSFLLYKNKSMKISNKISEKQVKLVDKIKKVYIIERVEKAQGPLVKGLRHRLFTAVTRVRIPYGLWVYRG